MTILKKTIVLSVFISLAAFVASANGATTTLVQDESASVAENGGAITEATYTRKGFEEYRTEIFAATNDEEIDAIVRQMQVQAYNETHADKLTTDEKIKEYLETPETTEQRRGLVENWKQTRETQKNAPKPIDPRQAQGLSTKIGRLVGSILALAAALWGFRKVKPKAK
jgi:hypothetical protein